MDSRSARVALWAGSILLAVAFLYSGLVKVLTPRDEFLAMDGMSWAESYSSEALVAIGVVEVMGALGLILPWLFGIARMLTPLAAAGLGIVMVLSIVQVQVDGDSGSILSNLVLLLLATFVAAGRLRQIRHS